MTQPAQVLDVRPTLARLLDDEFSESTIGNLLAPDPTISWEHWEQSLYAPLADFVSQPGKELRARLVESAWAVAGGRGSPPPELGSIIEALHAGSLIIDDIEDGSAYRRGAPALHCAYGVPRALNAGCWLYFWTHALVERLALAPALELAARRRIGETLLACHYGQALDLGVRIFSVEQREAPRVVRSVTRLKTGALVELAAALGAIAAGAKSDLVSVVAAFGRELGVGLQMFDDLSGLLREDRAHKAHEDLLLARAIWPFAWAARESSAETYSELTRMSAEVHRRDLHPEHLVEALRNVLGAEPAARGHAHLTRALAQLERSVGHSAASSELARLVQDLEAAYV